MKKLVAVMVCAMMMTGAFAAMGAGASVPAEERPTANDVWRLRDNAHFTTIQAAIGDAGTIKDDILRISPGVYYENVTVYKHLTIYGVDKTTTIIDAMGGYPISIISDWVNVSELTTRNSTTGHTYDAGIFTQSAHCRINDTISYDNYVGICVYSGAEFNEIRNNVIMNSAYMGIYGSSCHNTSFVNNTIQNGTMVGMNVGMNDGLIASNIVRDNAYNGISCSGSRNIIEKNSVIANLDDGIAVLGAASTKTIIRYNTVTGQLGTGIHLRLSSNDTAVYHNKVYANGQNAGYSTAFGWWNTSYPTGGNFWGDYTGIDVMHGPNQDIPGSDGIGDTPYNITGTGAPAQQDRYPLMIYREVRGPIRIDSDADFDTAHGVNGGNGTESNPWRIEKYEINATGSGCGIFVGNTTDHFVIENCYVHHATTSPTIYHARTGIYLYNATNGMVYGNNVSSNMGNGIYVRNNGATPGNNQILFNEVHGNNQAMDICGGIYVENSNWNVIRSNNFTKNVQYAIRIAPGNNNTIEGNSILTTMGAASGISLAFAPNNTISNNNISKNNASGIYLYRSPFTNIKENIIHDNLGYAAASAIKFESLSDKCTIIGNSITGNLNSDAGIEIKGSSLNLIEMNDITWNGGFGIYLWSTGGNSNDNTIVANNISDNVGQGIYIGGATLRNRMYHNTFYSNSVHDDGLNFWNATYPTGGNFWWNYTGPDSMHGAAQNIAGADGIGDTDYIFWTGYMDHYPLTKPTNDGKMVRPPFRINANADFGGWGFPGTGSKVDPWIIDGYDINGTGKGYCIYVGNTSQYFTISNCTTYNATGYTNSPWYLGAAIHIWNVIHGTVRSNNASGNDYAGIYLYASNYCDIVKNDAWREKNTSSVKGSGILISGGSMGTNISYNNLGWSKGPGIRVDDSRRTNISFNNVSYNNQAIDTTGGIFVSSYSFQSNNHTLWGNYIAHNPIYGVHIYGDNDTVVQNNDILFNCGGTAGLYSNLANRLTIDNNNISNGTGFGLLIEAMRNSTLTNNIVSSNYNGGVYFYNNCHDNRISGNDISGNGVSGAGDGFYAYHSNRNTFDNNSFRSNPNRGLAFFECSGNRIFRNDFIGNFVMQGDDYNGANFWNATYPVGGNFWSDYAGIDVMHGPYPQSLAGSDGMGEAFEPTSGPGTPDYYPLMQSTYAADLTPPNSNVTPITPYFRSTSPITITATATDLGGVLNVTLWYRHTTDNVSFGPWTKFGLDAGSPWSWSFTFPWVEGYYQFFSIANDTSGNMEAFKTTAETSCLYDTSAPLCTIGWTAPFWRNTSPLMLTATAGDSYSGMHLVRYMYEYSTDNTTWVGLSSTPFDGTVAPLWATNFSWSAEGYYRFYAMAMDWCGWWGNDGSYAYYMLDTTTPSSSVDVSGAYWRSTTPIALTATASDSLSGVSSVELWYRYATDNATWGAWANWGARSSQPWQYMFDWPSGDGYYEFQSRARDNATNYEALAGTADVRYAYDSTSPSSSVNSVAPYWHMTSPVVINATATDNLNPLALVELWYRHAPDNSTWGSWMAYGSFTTAPYSWNFNYPFGDGYYEFYSRANDTLGNYEAAPAVPDIRIAYDITPPASQVTKDNPYVHNPPNWQINATASDGNGSMDRVQLFYRHSPDNATWGAWTWLWTDTAAPWQWTFNSPAGAGYYEFYTIATDSAGNTEPAPASADARYRYLGDTTPPVSSVDAIPGYWRTTSPLTITAAATDALSGVKNVTLWFRSSPNNATWTAWMPYGTNAASPWSWSFGFPNGSAFYQFRTTSWDNAQNEEAAPATADAACAYDRVKPTILDTSALAGTTGDPFAIQATVADNLALDAVYAIYWFGTGAETNVTMSGSPRLLTLDIPSNSTLTLHYRLAAVDKAGNWNVTAAKSVPITDNDPPVANAGINKIVPAGSLVIFNASGSTDNIAIILYNWTVTHNGTTVYLSGASVSFKFWTVGNYSVVLNVSDEAGYVSTDTLLVRVVQPVVTLDTTAPVANAGLDAALDSGGIVLFDGSDSSDDVGVVNYTWTFTYNGTTRTLYGETPAFKFYTVGNYTVTLTVTDAAGNAASDTTVVRISSPATENDAKPGSYWWIVIIIVVVVLVVVLMLWFLMRRDKASARVGDKGPEAIESEAKKDSPGEGDAQR
jgi:parallel beta-helix repeat protein